MLTFTISVHYLKYNQFLLLLIKKSPKNELSSNIKIINNLIIYRILKTKFIIIKKKQSDDI